MPSIRIRILNEAETRAALPALCAILSDCVEGGASVGFLSPYPPESALPFWETVASAVGDEAVVLFAAEVDGEILGTAQLAVKLPPNQPHRGDVKKVLVHRKARGLGLGRLLMKAVEAEALRRGRFVLVLDTSTGSPAEAIYERLGWSRIGVIPRYALMPDGSFCGSTFFSKALDGEAETPAA